MTFPPLPLPAPEEALALALAWAGGRPPLPEVYSANALLHYRQRVPGPLDPYALYPIDPVMAKPGPHLNVEAERRDGPLRPDEPGPDFLAAAEAFLGSYEDLEFSLEPPKKGQADPRLTRKRQEWETAVVTEQLANGATATAAQEFLRVAREERRLRRDHIFQTVTEYSALSSFRVDDQGKATRGRPLLRLAYGSAQLGYCHGLYLKALYTDSFRLAVRCRGRTHQAEFVPGHLWHAMHRHSRFPVGPPAQPEGGFPSGYGVEVMVVGKMPGRDEHQRRRNFVGVSGEILAECCQETGLDDWYDFYVTNLLRFLNPDPAADTVPADLRRDCLPLLQQEIRLLRPRFLLLLGTEAVAAVLGRKATLRSTGGVVTILELPVLAPGSSRRDLEPRYETLPVQVVTSTHPARVAREPALREELLRQLRLLDRSRRQARGEVVPGGATQTLDYRMIDDVRVLRSLVEELLAQGCYEFAIDLEWNGPYPGEVYRNHLLGKKEVAWLRTIQFSWGEGKAAVLFVADEQGRPLEAMPLVEVRDLLTRLWKSPINRLIFHYGVADLPWLAHLGMDWIIRQFAPPEDDPLLPDGRKPHGWLPGWAKTAAFGGFDTILAAHAVEETWDLDLKSLGLSHTSLGRWDSELDRFLTETCTKAGIPKKRLPGYGFVPKEILGPYSAADADATFRLYRLFNGAEGQARPGMLDQDRFGQECRLPFWVAMRALPAFLEMSMNGLLFDIGRAEAMRQAFVAAHATLLNRLVTRINWPGFNPDSPYHTRALLFGEALTGKKPGKKGYVPVLPSVQRYIVLPSLRAVNFKKLETRVFNLRRYSPEEQVKKGLPAFEILYQEAKDNNRTGPYTADQPPQPEEFDPPVKGGPVDPTPFVLVMEEEAYHDFHLFEPEKTATYFWERSLGQDVVSLGLTPYKTTGKRPKLWEDVVAAGQAHLFDPSTDKESLVALATQATKDKVTTVELLRDVKILNQVIKSLLRAPDTFIEKRLQPDGSQKDDPYDEYVEGVLSFVHGDGRLRTHFSQTKETGRASSWGPALQNWSKRVQGHYDRIFASLGMADPGALRSTIQAPPGYMVIEADFQGAELDGMAGQAQDATMMDHCRRMKLPSDHPDHYDIHSAVAIQAFQLKWPDGRPLRPCKDDLKAAGFERKRDAAKPVDFGYAYGMGPGAAQRKAKEEGADISYEEAQGLIASLESLYPGLPAYFAQARERSQDPGFLVNAFGRRRRFYPARDQKTIGDQEREAQNMGIQSLVSDAISLAMGNLYQDPRRGRLGYRMVLQIHDSILFEVPIRNVYEFIQEVIPECMSRQVPIYPTDLSGKRLPKTRPYYLNTEVALYLRWGQKLTRQEAMDIGLDERLWPQERKK